jgi:hypothetical protein
MLRSLMVLEDYGELMFLQTVLKKIGFDVDAIQNPRGFNDSLLRMNPDILVMTAFGKRVKGLELSRGVKKVRDLPHIVLLRSSGQEAEEDPGIDRWLEAPVGALSLLDCIADLSHLNKNVLQEKFQKLHLQEVEEEQARILKINEIAEPVLNREGGSGNFGVLKESTMTSDERKQRYAGFLSSEAPPKHGFTVKQVQEQIKDLRRQEDGERLADLERERRAFVEHLFKKKA